MIDQDGVTFLFAPSSIAPYAMGTLESKIYFDRDPSLFTGNYGASGDGYVKTMSPYTEMAVDLDGDGSEEKLSVTGVYEEGNEIDAYSASGFRWETRSARQICTATACSLASCTPRTEETMYMW